MLDQTVLKYVEPAAQSWDGSETPERLVVTTNMGKCQLIFHTSIFFNEVKY